jgi:hypothetical protein
MLGIAGLRHRDGGQIQHPARRRAGEPNQAANCSIDCHDTPPSSSKDDYATYDLKYAYAVALREIRNHSSTAARDRKSGNDIHGPPSRRCCNI